MQPQKRKPFTPNRLIWLADELERNASVFRAAAERLKEGEFLKLRHGTSVSKGLQNLAKMAADADTQIRAKDIGDRMNGGWDP